MRRSGRLSPLRLAGVALAATVLAACGSGGAGTSESSTIPDPQGILKYGYPMPVAGLHFDPTQSVLAPDIFWMAPVLGSLLRQDEDGTIRPGLAKGAEVVDPQTVRITLRQGVTFSDGTPFDAQAVQAGLMRSKTPATPAAKGGQDPAIKTLTGVEIADPTTLVAKLSQPLAGQLVVELSQRPGVIVSPKQVAANPAEVDTKPIGAGPFVVAENTPQQRVSLRKNPIYWDAANVQLGGVDIINTPTGPQQVNGLLAGSLDWSSYVSADSVDSLPADRGYTTRVTPTYNVELALCTGKAPFDSAAFRQAVQLGIDRDRYGQLAFSGKTVPAYSYFREDSKYFAPTTKDVVKYDPDKAKQLLASSGVATPAFDLHYPTTLDFGSKAEVLQSQLQAIGISTKIVADRDLAAGFITPQQPGGMLFATIGSVPGYGTFARHFGPGGFFSLCGVDRPDVMAAVNKAAGLDPNDPAAVAAYQKAQEIVAQQAYVIPIVAYPNVAGWNTAKVGGTPKWNPFGYPQFDSVFVKK